MSPSSSYSSRHRGGWFGCARSSEDNGHDVALPHWRRDLDPLTGLPDRGLALAGAILMSGHTPRTWLHHLHDLLHHAAAHGEYPHASHDLLVQVREAIVSGDLASAEALLRDCEGRESDPECLNLLGVISETRGQWRQARRHWSHALWADRSCRAAEHNLRRYYELFTFGECGDRVALGDEPELYVAARNEES